MEDRRTNRRGMGVFGAAGVIALAFAVVWWLQPAEQPSRVAPASPEPVLEAPAEPPPTRLPVPAGFRIPVEADPSEEVTTAEPIPRGRPLSERGGMSRRDWVEAGMPADHPALGGVEGEWLPAHFGVAHPDEEAEYRPSPVTADLPPVVFAEIGKQIGARDADEVRAWIEEQNDRVREANQMLFEHSGRLRELWDAGDEEGADALIQQLIDEGMGADATH